MNLNQDRYAASIPRWCGLRTLEQHLDIGLCWSLSMYVERLKQAPLASCYRCRHRDKKTPGDPGVYDQTFYASALKIRTLGSDL